MKDNVEATIMEENISSNAEWSDKNIADAGIFLTAEELDWIMRRSSEKPKLWTEKETCKIQGRHKIENSCESQSPLRILKSCIIISSEEEGTRISQTVSFVWNFVKKSEIEIEQKFSLSASLSSDNL